MDGQWRGELPGFGKDCRILFDGGSRVSAACQDLPHRSGLGKYRLDGPILAMEWMTVAEGGRTMPNTESFLRLQIAGSGNEIVLTPAGGGSSFAWRRAAR